MAKTKVEDAVAVTVGAAHKKYFYATFLWFPSGSIGNSGNNTAGQRLQWTQVRTGAVRHLLHLLSIKWHFPWLPACLSSSSPSASSLTSPSPFPFSTWSSCGSCNAAYFSLRLKCCFRSLRNSNPNCKWEKWQENVLNGGGRGKEGGWVENDVSHSLLGVLMGHRFAPLSHIINH